MCEATLPAGLLPAHKATALAGKAGTYGYGYGLGLGLGPDEPWPDGYAYDSEYGYELMISKMAQETDADGVEREGEARLACERELPPCGLPLPQLQRHRCDEKDRERVTLCAPCSGKNTNENPNNPNNLNNLYNLNREVLQIE